MFSGLFFFFSVSLSSISTFFFWGESISTYTKVGRVCFSLFLIFLEGYCLMTCPTANSTDEQCPYVDTVFLLTVLKQKKKWLLFYVLNIIIDFYVSKKEITHFIFFRSVLMHRHPTILFPSNGLNEILWFLENSNLNKPQQQTRINRNTILGTIISYATVFTWPVNKPKYIPIPTPKKENITLNEQYPVHPREQKTVEIYLKNLRFF